MIIEMEKGASEREIGAVISRVRENNFKPHVSRGEERTLIGVLGSETGSFDTQIFQVMPGVKAVVRMETPYKISSRGLKAQDTVVDVGGVKIGGRKLVIIAGPCAVESEAQVLACANFVKDLGIKFLRGGAFKPRTTPFAFQGLGEAALKI